MKTVLLIQSVCDVVYYAAFVAAFFIDLIVKKPTILMAAPQWPHVENNIAFNKVNWSISVFF